MSTLAVAGPQRWKRHALCMQRRSSLRRANRLIFRASKRGPVLTVKATVSAYVDHDHSL